jgi:hypothetical protein
VLGLYIINALEAEGAGVFAVVLICISLIVGDTEYFFIYLLALWVPPFENAVIFNILCPHISQFLV